MKKFIKDTKFKLGSAVVALGTLFITDPVFAATDPQAKLDYDPNVKVQMIRPKNKYKSDIQSAIDETAKYPVKDTDFMTDDEEKNLKRLSDLEEGLHRKRLISYGGLLKEIHKKLNLDDTEEGDLIHTDDDEKADEDGFSIIAMWNWERKNYFIKE